MSDHADSAVGVNDCPICGQPIPERPRGSRHGHPPKTCSEACRKKRAAAREKERYSLVKDTEHWKEVRAGYLTKLRARLDADPEFAAIFRAEANARTREWNKRLRAADPARHAEMKAEKRAERAEWRRSLESDPQAWEAHKSACRAWYASLNVEERERIFYTPRQRGRGEKWRRINWTPELDALLGELPDKFIAEKIGASTVSVIHRRNKLGKPPCRPSGPQFSMRRSSVNNELTRWRERLNLSQVEAGRELAINGASFMRLEKNIQKNRLRKVYLLACAAIEQGIEPIK